MNCVSNKNVVTRAFLENKNIAYHAVIKDMQHLGFSDLKHNIPMKSMVGGLDANVAHDNVCRIQLEFFDTYLKNLKDQPDFTDNDVVSFTQYSPN